MKSSGAILFILVSYSFSFSLTLPNLTNAHKGDFYFYWGWNRGWYSNSDISFKGNNYDFELKSVVAKDRQSTVNLNTYLNPIKATIPQYNFRIGYFIHEKYNISFGVDHMKYVVQQHQTAKISGEIAGTNGVYDHSYTNEDIKIETDFLKFEHTDGLNYLNLGLRRLDLLWRYKKIKINATEGIDAGILLPRTDVTLLNNARNDKFHLAGFGVSAAAALNIQIYEHFFIQTELKGGFINMPDIRTTMHKSDKASQHFFFNQFNVVLGSYIKNRKTAKLKTSE